MRIPRRYSHFVFGVIQAGITCLVSSAIANDPLHPATSYGSDVLQAWLLSWLMMIPFVLLAAPLIRAMVDRLTAARHCGRD